MFSEETGELKTSRGHLMPPPRSSICIINLPVLRTIPFLHGIGLARLQASPCWRRNGLVRMDIVLAYDHRGASVAGLRPVQLPCGRANVRTGQTSGRTPEHWDIHRDKVKTQCSVAGYVTRSL